MGGCGWAGVDVVSRCDHFVSPVWLPRPLPADDWRLQASVSSPHYLCVRACVRACVRMCARVRACMFACARARVTYMSMHTYVIDREINRSAGWVGGFVCVHVYV